MSKYYCRVGINADKGVKGLAEQSLDLLANCLVYNAIEDGAVYSLKWPVSDPPDLMLRLMALARASSFLVTKQLTNPRLVLRRPVRPSR